MLALHSLPRFHPHTCPKTASTQDGFIVNPEPTLSQIINSSSKQLLPLRQRGREKENTAGAWGAAGGAVLVQHGWPRPGLQLQAPSCSQRPHCHHQRVTATCPCTGAQLSPALPPVLWELSPAPCTHPGPLVWLWCPGTSSAPRDSRGVLQPHPAPLTGISPTTTAPGQVPAQEGFWGLCWHNFPNPRGFFILWNLQGSSQTSPFCFYLITQLSPSQLGFKGL